MGSVLFFEGFFVILFLVGIAWKGLHNDAYPTRRLARVRVRVDERRSTAEQPEEELEAPPIVELLIIGTIAVVSFLVLAKLV